MSSAPAPSPSPTWRRSEISLLRASEFVEYERVAALKLAALARVFAQFPGDPAFDAYVAQQGRHLHDFATYCALDAEMHRRDPNIWLWTDWPQQYHAPRSEAVADFAAGHQHDVLFHKFLQWHIDRQLAEAQAHALASGMKIGLYHDLALATDRFGTDLWANSSFYVKGARVGSPPDDFSPNGQDWAFPPPNRDAHRDNGYQLFAQSIRNNARHGGALRIDHVMRFFRLYWIPDGMPATKGAYVRDYANDLLGILALESVRGNFIVIGEDLGTVTGEVRQSLAETGILSYRLLWFQRDQAGNFLRPGEYPAHAVVSTTTHDLPTLAGFDSGRDIEARKAAGLIDEEVLPLPARRPRRRSRPTQCRPVSHRFHRRPPGLPPLDPLLPRRRESRGPDRRNRAAKPPRQHLAVSELAQKNENPGRRFSKLHRIPASRKAIARASR